MTRARWLPVLVALGLGTGPAVGADSHRPPSPLERCLNQRLETLQRAAANFKPARQQGPPHPTLAELRRPGLVVDRVPANPLNGSAEIQAATWDEAGPPVSGTAGWNYDEQAGKIWPDCRMTDGAVPADGSLAFSGYRSRGVPDLEGRWDGSSALAAARVLRKLGPSRLPRLDSPRSGALFERLVAPGNFDACRDRSRHLSDRLVDAARHMTAAGDLLDLYARAYTSADVGDFEPLAIQAQSLRAAALVAEVGDEVLADSSGTARDVANRRQGIQKIHAGLAALVAKNIEMLDSMEACPGELRQWLVQRMAQSVPVIVARLPEDSRMQLAGQIRSIEAADLQPALAGLAAAIDAARAARSGELTAAADEP